MAPGAGRMSRFLVTWKSIRTKVDFVEDPWDLLAKPEILHGIRILGIDDIYVRKIRIGISSEGYRPRDPLDLHALDRDHFSLRKRIAGCLDVRTAKAAYLSLRALPPRAVQAAVQETRYGFDAKTVLPRVTEEFEQAIMDLERTAR